MSPAVHTDVEWRVEGGVAADVGREVSQFCRHGVQADPMVTNRTTPSCG
jgi:hypothetical protein